MIKLVLYTLIYHSTLSSAEKIRVSLKLGTVVGTKRDFNGKVVEEYLGIPYGEPPVGEFRFQTPRPKVLTGDFDATQWPSSCPQPNKFPMRSNSKNISEDCLYLNIWSYPLTEGQLKAVMIFIHGGGYAFGSSTQPEYYGLPLAATGDVVLVTINYRLGPIGFLYSDSDDAPGNAGLWDQSLAMVWVKDNIEYFGGDPDKVTIFGESAGAMSVTTHILSPHSMNLFKNAIAMSGATLGNTWITSKDVMLQRSRSLANLVNCKSTTEEGPLSNDVVNCMKKIDFEVLMSLHASSDVIGDKFWNFGFVPIYGDNFLPEDPRISLSNGNYKKNMSLLVGTTDDEGGYFATAFPFLKPSVKDTFEGNDTDAYKLIARKYLLDMNISSVTTEDAIELFFSLDADQKKAIASLFGDLTLTCPPLLFGKRLTDYNKVYGYTFTYARVDNNDLKKRKVWHYEDNIYMFGMPIFQPIRFTDDDRTTSLDMIRIWTDFAKDGNPGWPGFMRTSGNTVIPRTLDFNPVRGNVLKTSFKHDLCKLFEKELIG